MFAEVIVDISHGDVDRIFEYSVGYDGVSVGSRVIVPFGSYKIEGFVIRVKEKSDFPPEKIKPVLSVLEEIPALTEETLKVANFIIDNYYVTHAAALRLFLPVEMRKGKVREKTKKYVTLKDGVIAEEVVKTLKTTAKKQREFIFFLEENGKVEFSIINEMFGASAVKTVIEKGFAEVFEEKVLRSPYKELKNSEKQITLTEKQHFAVESIENTDKLTTLLFGVTGSGKTEVYLELIDKTIKNGRTAIMLVPEISLTPQMLRQLRARFGETAAILHSGLSSGERFDEWWRLRTGEAKIAIGARSAIFAPLENIGIIIIDEEHDGSYASESSPRYVTAEVAEFRARENGAKLVIGSATPSIDSFLKAREGIYNLVELPDRINKKPLPVVEVADMRKEIKRGNSSPFSSILKEELEHCLQNGNQALIFLNQRGYSKTVVCTECGHVQKCQSCDVSLTYHREDESLLCHYCGAKYKMITACTECGSPFIRYGGVGTERVVAELKKFFPSAKILRMDRDTTQTKEGHLKILTEFAQRKADVLVGTQMIAKGHDFPFVTLVGILDADMSLHFSDFRSGERTFQLITQVAGRSGRADKAGTVVLQTYSPQHPVLLRAINYDYVGFYEQEISIRKATRFPPFADIIRVLISSIQDEQALSATQAIYKEIKIMRDENKVNFLFLGCMKAPLKKLQGKFRYQVLMRIIPHSKELKDKIYGVVKRYNAKTVSAYMEVNPNNLT